MKKRTKKNLTQFLFVRVCGRSTSETILQRLFFTKYLGEANMSPNFSIMTQATALTVGSNFPCPIPSVIPYNSLFLAIILKSPF